MHCASFYMPCLLKYVHGGRGITDSVLSPPHHVEEEHRQQRGSGVRVHRVWDCPPQRERRHRRRALQQLCPL
eukprot:m.1471271 g.1471271  ORF g.1471271 m.1471271 type:complete len:72 (-) comp25146_c0_seq4:287-502(-)